MKNTSVLAILAALAVLGLTPHALPAAENGVAVAIIYDTSGSMRDAVKDTSGKSTAKYVIANRALTGVANQIQAFATNTPSGTPRRIDAGLFVFNGDSARAAVPFGPFNAEALKNFAAKFNNPNGNTPLGNALSTASRFVLNSPLTRKHVLVIREGATENAEAAKDLLEHLVSQGVDPSRRRLFVIDGSKALRTAINAVFGAETPVQRCRNHKLRNVLGRLPREQQAQTASLMRAAWKLGEKEGMAKFRQMAGWLEHDYPDAARSLLEGLEECFTINRLDVPRSLHRCLATSNVVDNPHSGVRSRTRRVCRWRAGMPARWSAAAFLETEKSYRRIMGHRDLWALKAILERSQPATRQAVA